MKETSPLLVHSTFLLYLVRWLTHDNCYIPFFGSLQFRDISDGLVHSSVLLHPQIGFTRLKCYIKSNGSLLAFDTS